MAEQPHSQEYVSDPTKGWLLSRFAPLSGFVLVAFAVYRLGAHEDWGWFAMAGCIGGFWIAIYLKSRGKFGVVTVNEAEVRVRHNDSEYRFPWRDVKSFRSVPLVNPPIYRLTFEDSELVTYFVPMNWRQLWFDTSPMGKFIRKRLRDVRGLM